MGIAGGHWSRFTAFTYSPRVTLDFLRGRAGPEVAVGHTPLGAVSVYALLLFLSAQFATGLFSEDQADFMGPLSILVSNRAVRLLTAYHRNVGQFVVIALALLHMAAIAYYQLRRRQDLIGPMWRGDKQARVQVPGSRDDVRSRVLALAVFALSCATIAWLISLGDT